LPEQSTLQPESEELPLAPARHSRIVIVGGRGALGQRLLQACLHHGHEVAVLDLPRAPDATDRTREALAIDVDASDENSVRQAFVKIASHWSHIDHVYFLVGFSTIPPVPLRDLDIAEWDRVIDGNLRSAYLTLRAAIALLDGGREPSIVVVSSALTIAPQKGYGAYIASKLGVSGLVKALGIELAPGIRVNAVAPSVMLTPFLTGGSSDTSKRDWFDAKAAASVMPLGRLCTPDDVVGPILFLSSPAARFITGQTLHVSGGRVMP